MNSKVFLYALLIGCFSSSVAMDHKSIRHDNIMLDNSDGRLKKYPNANHIEPTKPTFKRYGQVEKTSENEKKMARTKSPLARVMDIMD